MIAPALGDITRAKEMTSSLGSPRTTSSSSIPAGSGMALPPNMIESR